MGEGRSKFWFPPTEGGIWKIKKRAWKYGAGAGLYKGGRSTVQGQVFIKGGGGADTFPISLFQGLSFLHLESTLPFAKPCYAFENKKFFFCHHNFMKKGHSKLSKNEPEDIP